MRQPFDHRWVAKHLPHPPRVIFDVGTWDANDAIAFKHNWPQARVVAFEACPVNHAKIMARGLAVAEGVEVEHGAVCDRIGVVPFHSCEDANLGPGLGMSGSIHQPTEKLLRDAPNLGFGSPRNVRSLRLDEFCRGKGIEQIDVLHVDVQGAEISVLTGLGTLRPGMIFLETDETEEAGHYAGAASRVELFTLRNVMGYACVWDSGSDQLWIRKSDR